MNRDQWEHEDIRLELAKEFTKAAIIRREVVYGPAEYAAFGVKVADALLAELEK